MLVPARNWIANFEPSLLSSDRWGRIYWIKTFLAGWAPEPDGGIKTYWGNKSPPCPSALPQAAPTPLFFYQLRHLSLLPIYCPAPSWDLSSHLVGLSLILTFPYTLHATEPWEGYCILADPWDIVLPPAPSQHLSKYCEIQTGSGSGHQIQVF